MIKRILCVLLLTLVAALATAQPDLFHRPGFLAGRTMLTLSLFDEVRTELKTPADFNGKSDALLEKYSSEVQDVVQNSGGDFTAIRPQIEKLNAQYDDEVVKLLTSDQVSRLKQLFIQYNGANAITNPLISKDLGITDDQKAKIKTVQEDNFKKTAEVFQGGGSPEDNRTALAKLQEDLKTALANVLTDDQKKKFEDMKGAKFEFKKVEAPAGQ